jgi:ATP-dependent helicase YprA (DUF1998 family)
MTALNPLKSSHEITETYSRYLQSLIHPRQESLAKAISGAITDSIKDENGIVKGPYLEATPPYTTGKTIRELVTEGLLSSEFLKLGSNEFPLDRPTYTHQEQAIRKLADGRNALIATGTGSGKTESFLIPIIDHLMREKEKGTLGPGVRALLLYPMNALANDQVKRIREMLGNYPDITFGRYTGETQSDPKTALERYRRMEGNAPPVNELISRKQMQETPPNILLTNYAMLEYLLLRPEDHEIFNGAHSSDWSFIVADEAHTYDGAHGVEVSMLLRKLRERVDSKRQIQTVGTTATIGGNAQDKQKFAENFFGNDFQISDVEGELTDLITPSRETLAAGSWGPIAPSDWEQFVSADDFHDQAVSRSAGDDDRAKEFVRETSVALLREELLKGPKTITALAPIVFGEGSDLAEEAIVKMVELGSQIQDEFGRPVFSARYHLFASATEGIFACLSEEPHATLNRHAKCEICELPSFEVAGCKRCGAAYYVGKKIDNEGKSFLIPSVSDNETKGRAVYAYVVEDLPGSDDGDQVIFGEAETESAANESVFFLCISCGLIHYSATQSCENCSAISLVEVKFTERDNKCEYCLGRGGRLLRKLESGNNAAASVLGSKLYQELPPIAGELAAQMPGQGRKLMIFSDNRQQAAFFAPYMQDAFEKILWRKLIYRGLVDAETAYPNSEIDLGSLVKFVKPYLQSKVLGFSYETELRADLEIAKHLHYEAVSTDQQANLEGTGLIVWDIDLPTDESAYAQLIQNGMKLEDARALIYELLNSLRTGGMLSAKSGVDVASDLFKPRIGPLFIREAAPDKKIRAYSWLPAAQSNSRLSFTKAVLEKLEIDLDPQELLKGIWLGLTAKTGLLAGLLVSNNTNGIVFQLNRKKLRLRSINRVENIFVCDLCGRKSLVSAATVCPRFRCTGEMKKTSAHQVMALAENGYYAHTYKEEGLFGLTASEHTAQLETTFAAEVQQSFIEGRINVLSSSTTFELGVDVGELQSVLLRNVPPSVANYIQRAGRAGRRADSAALVLTYAQRRPHDLSMFSDPVKMVSGDMRAPFVELSNQRIFQRHIYSLFFAAYFKSSEMTKLGKIGDFLTADGQSMGDKVVAWVHANQEELRGRFDAIIPPQLAGNSDTIWSKTVHEFGTLFASVKAAFEQEIKEYEDLIDGAAKDKKFRVAESLQKTLRTIKGKDLIGFLSSHNLIPKYGFPVDTVPLIPRRGESPARASQVELDRDLAIAIFEYAPGNELIAAGVIWESIGLQKPYGAKDAEKGFVRIQYSKCQECDEYQERKYVPGNKIQACANCNSTKLRQSSYVRPEWGFVARGGSRSPGENRKTFSATRSLFLNDQGIATLFAGKNTPAGVVAEHRSVARLVIINSGPGGLGFNWCTNCDYCIPKIAETKPKEHERPHSADNKCKTTYRENVDLGHSFETDIVHISIDISSAPFTSMDVGPAVAYALLEGASDGLQIAHDDIDVVLLPSPPKTIKIALVDAVPAGAGYAKLIAENVGKVFETALERVERCECGPETSCYKCLRSYRNQKDHDTLARKDAVQALRFMLKKGS